MIQVIYLHTTEAKGLQTLTTEALLYTLNDSIRFQKPRGLYTATVLGHIDPCVYKLPPQKPTSHIYHIEVGSMSFIYKHSYSRVSHFLPLYPGAQWHLKPLRVSSQVPPFKQLTSAHCERAGNTMWQRYYMCVTLCAGHMSVLLWRACAFMVETALQRHSTVIGNNPRTVKIQFGKDLRCFLIVIFYNYLSMHEKRTWGSN